MADCTGAKCDTVAIVAERLNPWFLGLSRAPDQGTMETQVQGTMESRVQGTMGTWSDGRWFLLSPITRIGFFAHKDKIQNFIGRQFIGPSPPKFLTPLTSFVRGVRKNRARRPNFST